jgi:EAL domain-containing protein (putative c-di-GMP-specific phosphodiesterase class I)
MEAPAEAIGTLRRLRAAGFGVTIDDFGSGQSSLGYLARLPATTLKLDRSLVQAMGADARTTSVVAMVVRLAGEFGMRVVAEGLEAPEAAGLLMEIGCHEVQGFLLARPMPAAAFEDWLGVEAPQLAMRLSAMRVAGAA